MTLFDMPVHELHAYAGSNPRPDDFDAYWSRGLAELDAIDPDPKRTQAGFAHPSATCEHLRFTGVGGARIHAKLLTPTAARNDGPGPAICLFHGYRCDSGGWFDKLGWVAAGYTVAALDCRGQAGLSEDIVPTRGVTSDGHIVKGLGDEPDKLYYRNCFLDTVQLARLVMDMPGVDPDRVAAHGGSQGGGLTLACAALEPRIRRAAPVEPFLCDYRRVWDIDCCENAYREIRDYFRKFDPTHARAEEIWTTLGYIDCAHLAPRIKADTLMATGLRDEICPPSTQFAAYNRIASPKEVVLYHDFAHEHMPELAERVWRFMSTM